MAVAAGLSGTVSVRHIPRTYVAFVYVPAMSRNEVLAGARREPLTECASMQRLGLERTCVAFNLVTVPRQAVAVFREEVAGWEDCVVVLLWIRSSMYIQHVRMHLSHNEGRFEQPPPSPPSL